MAVTIKTMQKYFRGSEWRKWDLHFHTPSSYDHDNKANTSEEIAEALKKQQIKVVAITDHHIIDSQVIEKLKKAGGDDLTVLPGIEFCSDSRGSEPVHFIGIFPENSDVNYIWNEIQSQAKIASQRQSGQKDNEIYCDLKDTANLIKRLGGVVSIHAGRKSNSIEKITNSLPVKMAEKKDIASEVQIFELGQEKDQADYRDTVFKKIGFFPMVICSDNHNVKKYSLKQNCWIKADPTFEGLKQIIYEPECRVKIQELKPEEKSDYCIIDRAEFTNHDGSKQIVYFNQNLNSVIGSRATGKSNLLRNIAFSIDPVQCRLKGVDGADFLQLKNFKLFWRDGKVSSLKETEDKGVLFIPQKYLGDLVYEKNVNFDNFLSNLFENKDNFKNALQNYKKFEDENVLSITSLVRELLAIRNNGREKGEKLKKLGKKEDLEKEILKIEASLNLTRKSNSEVTNKELENYKKINSDKAAQEREIKIIDKDLASFKMLKQEEVISADKILEFEFSQKYVIKMEAKLKESDEVFKKDFIEKEITELVNSKENVKKKIKELDTELKPLQTKVEKHQALLMLTKTLQEKAEILKTINETDEEIIKLRASYSDRLSKIVEKYSQFNEQFKSLSINLGSLAFSKVDITTSFDTQSFKKFIEDNINYHNSISFKENPKNEKANTFLREPEQWDYKKIEFSLLLKQLTLGILTGQLILKSGKNEEILLMELFRNRFKVDFQKSIKSRNGDEFVNMSDGEKMLALLEFIFKFDDYNYPVLLDQPEDDLDAKAISKHIVDFLKAEKIKRQIIIASHNANLVVCGDSEEVVVSNKTAGKNPNFTYESGAIENPAIRDEIIEILEGGKKALEKRRDKLNLSN